jgi:hypothetical protein
VFIGSEGYLEMNSCTHPHSPPLVCSSRSRGGAQLHPLINGLNYTVDGRGNENCKRNFGGNVFFCAVCVGTRSDGWFKIFFFFLKSYELNYSYNQMLNCFCDVS